MLRKRNKLIFESLFLAVFLLNLGISLSTVQTSLFNSLFPVNRSTSQSYTAHDPIIVANDNQLAAVANSGTGVVNDPYIIANWNIIGSKTHGIYMAGTTKYFRIENCWIANSSYYGIFVGDVATGTATITNNTCNNNRYHGISFDYSDSSTIVNNICTNNNENGISFFESSSSTIANNTCTSNGRAGIFLGDSNSSTITNNTCTSNTVDGIDFGHSGSSTIVNNTCNSNNKNGISLSESSSSVVANNTCISNGGVGISLSESSSSVVANNTCISNGGAGIYLRDSSSSTVVNNMFFDDGLVLGTSSKEEIFSYTVENNTVNEIPLGYFENITDSTITETCGQLILVNCNNTIAKNQNCSNTSIGIALHYCNENQLANNTCTNNSAYGIYLSYSIFSTVTNNTCTSNGEDGISLDYSDHNSIVWNTLFGNGHYGIELSENSDNNSIHHNSFIVNGQDNSQGYDDGSNNQWYDETLLEGNSWSDYFGTGSYFIAGSAGSSDPYPSLLSTTDLNSFFSILTRIGLFLIVLGLLGVSFFLTRRKKTA